MRTLVILIALALIFMVGKRLLQSSRPPVKRPGKQGQMVQCAHCGIYIPSQEALSRSGRNYCSAAHRDADPDHNA